MVNLLMNNYFLLASIKRLADFGILETSCVCCFFLVPPTFKIGDFNRIHPYSYFAFRSIVQCSPCLMMNHTWWVNWIGIDRNEVNESWKRNPMTIVPFFTILYRLFLSIPSPEYLNSSFRILCLVSFRLLRWNTCWKE